MNLRDLDYFLAVAEQLHFGKAARHCHVSQPTLSMQLRKLEAYLGVQLVERGQAIRLTDQGVVMARHAKRIQQEVAQMREVAQASKNPLAGTLRLGIFPTLAPYLLPQIVPALRQAFPQLSLLLREEKSAALVTQLEQGDLDCALLAMPLSGTVPTAPATLTGGAIFEEPFLLAVPPQHRLASRKHLRLATLQKDLKGEAMLLLDEGHCLRDQALAVCHHIGIGEAATFRATSLETLRHMVASGNGITFLPRLAIRADDHTLRSIPFTPPSPSRQLGLFWRKTSARQLLYEKIQALLVRTCS